MGQCQLHRPSDGVACSRPDVSARATTRLGGLGGSVVLSRSAMRWPAVPAGPAACSAIHSIRSEFCDCLSKYHVIENRTWGHNEIDETMLCTTLFRDRCGDSSLLLSTVISLPCEAVPVSSQATYGARRAVGTHHWPTRIHLADYSLRHRRDGNADTTMLYPSHPRNYRRHHSSSVMTAGRRELLEHGHRRSIRRGSRTFRGTTGRTC